MFAVATGNQKTFEVGIFNKDVRALVKQNRSHLDYGDAWADVHFQNVVAETEEEAMAMIEERYPAQSGFVVSAIRQYRTSIFAT